MKWKLCVLNRPKAFLFDFLADISLLFSIYLQPWVKKNTSYVFAETKVSLARKTKVLSYKRWREKYNCHICCRAIASCFLGKHTHETYTLLRLCLIKFFVRSYSIHIRKLPRQRTAWVRIYNMLPLYLSRKLHSLLSEIVSLVDFQMATKNPFFTHWLKLYLGMYWKAWLTNFLSEHLV